MCSKYYCVWVDFIINECYTYHVEFGYSFLIIFFLLGSDRKDLQTSSTPIERSSRQT